MLALGERDEMLPGVPVDGVLADLLLDADFEIPVAIQDYEMVNPEQSLQATPLRINLSERRVTPLRINLSQHTHPSVPPLRFNLPQPQVVSPIRINRSRLQVVSPLRINRSRLQSTILDSPTPGISPIGLSRIQTVQTGLDLEEEIDVSIVHGDDAVEIIPDKYSLIPISPFFFQTFILLGTPEPCHTLRRKRGRETSPAQRAVRQPGPSTMPTVLA